MKLFSYLPPLSCHAGSFLIGFISSLSDLCLSRLPPAQYNRDERNISFFKAKNLTLKNSGMSVSLKNINIACKAEIYEIF